MYCSYHLILLGLTYHSAVDLDKMCLNRVVRVRVCPVDLDFAGREFFECDTWNWRYIQAELIDENIVGRTDDEVRTDKEPINTYQRSSRMNSSELSYHPNAHTTTMKRINAMRPLTLTRGARTLYASLGQALRPSYHSLKSMQICINIHANLSAGLCPSTEKV